MKVVQSYSSNGTSTWPAMNIPKVKRLEKNINKEKGKEDLEPGSNGATPGYLALNWEIRPAPPDLGGYNQKEPSIESKHNQPMEVMENMTRDQDMVLDCFDETINTSKSDGEVEVPETTIMHHAQIVTKQNNLSPRNNHNTGGGHFFKCNK